MLKRLVHWIKRLLFGEPPTPRLTSADLGALADSRYGVPTQGWFLWESERYRQSGGTAFWFDPWRYGDIDVPQSELVENYERSLKHALRTGKREVEQATAWVASLPNLRDRHRANPDPIGWCIRAWKAAGEPEHEVPAEWLARSSGIALRSSQMLVGVGQPYTSLQGAIDAAYGQTSFASLMEENMRRLRQNVAA